MVLLDQLRSKHELHIKLGPAEGSDKHLRLQMRREIVWPKLSGSNNRERLESHQLIETNCCLDYLRSAGKRWIE